MEETQSTPLRSEHTLRLEKIAAIVLMATAFLLPIFFIPSGLFSVPFAKSFLLYLGVIASFVIFLFSVLESGKIRLPQSPVFYIGFFVPIFFLISSLSSISVPTSLSGYGVEVGTFAFVLLMFLLLFLVTALYRTKERVFYSYLLYFGAFGLITLYQVLRLIFGANFLSFGLLTTGVSNFIGSWNDLGVFFSISTLLAVITLELLPVSKLFKGLLYAALVLSLLFVSIVNFSTLWYILAAFSLIFFLFVLFMSKEKGESREGDHEGRAAHGLTRKISYLSLVVLALSLVFILGGNSLGGHIADALKISNLEVRPSWTTTLNITKSTLAHNALLGSGPNTFQYQWAKYKPTGINTTAFWNTDFSYGIGLIPTFLATSGILGFLAWLGVIIALIYTGMRAIFSRPKDPLTHYLITSSFIASVCLWATLVLYIPSMVMVALTFFFTGLFLASVSNENLIKHKTISLYSNARVGFAAVLLTVFLLILSISGGYYMTRNFISSAYFQKSLSAASQNSIDVAEKDMQDAISLRGYDIYYRSLAEIQMVRLNAILTTDASSTDATALKQQFQATLGSAIQSGLNAVSADPSNYQNYLELGQIYESVVPAPFKIDGAYDKAKETYTKAQALNPQNPEIPLLMGRLEIAQGNLDAARTDINLALQEKSDYVDAYFLLSQVEASAGNLTKAIASVQSATYLAPDNAGLYFQLGLLNYDNNDAANAIPAFEKAVSLVPNYANAQYFLGLSYYKANRTQDAIAQFEALAVSNPDNSDVKLILANLKAGKQPFDGVASPVDAQPEKAENLPVNQQ